MTTERDQRPADRGHADQHISPSDSRPVERGRCTEGDYHDTTDRRPAQRGRDSEM